MTLSNDQYNCVVDSVTSTPADLSEQRLELIDHLCCLVEESMQDNVSFNNALALSLEALGLAEMKLIERKTKRKLNYKKRVLMKTLAITAILAIASAVTIKYQEVGQPTIWPLPTMKNAEVSAAYGWRVHPIYKVRKFHAGMDVKAPQGTPVVAVADGKIDSAGNMKDYGNCVVVSHPNGYSTKYAHLN